MEVELRPISSIIPYDNNPRVNDHAVAAVATSIKEYGFRQPIVVDEDGVIIAGHTRYKAALKLGLKMVPVHVARGLTPAQVRAYRLADNRTAELAEWDDGKLIQELLQLQKDDYDVRLTGFGVDDLLRLADSTTATGCDPDDVPDQPDKAITQPGDLWLLGSHRLLCGDSSVNTDVDRLLDGAPVHVVNADAPYNVKVEPRSNNSIQAGLSSFGSRQRSSRKGRPRQTTLRPRDRLLKNDFVSEAEFARLLQAWFGNLARALLPGRCFFVWGGYSNIGNFPQALQAAGLYYSQQIIWVKEHLVLTRKVFLGNHEWCFFGWREGAAHQFFGPKDISDVWSVKKVAPQVMVHLTEKPVELARRALQYASRPGENALDLFGGSGSTLIAAEQAERRAFVMELDPLYCDVIVERWQRFTGRRATRQEA